LGNFDSYDPLVKSLGLPGQGYDWGNVFAYGGAPVWVGELPPTEKVAGFNLDDVACIDKAEAVESENEGNSWLAFGLLKDGRWFFITAGCDYTGWG